MASLQTQLSGNRFLVIGRAGMDLYPDPPGTPIEEASQFTAGLGGSSANIAAGLSRLGASAALATRVSDDAVGRFAINALHNFGVDTSHVHSISGEFRNSLALSESRMKGHQTVIYRNGAADFQMVPEDIEAIDFSRYDAIITTGTVLAAEPSRTSALLAFDKARDAGIPLIFDVDYRPYSWTSPQEAADVYSRAAALCDVIVGNDDEFGFMANGYDQGLNKARDLAHTTAALVVYKMGAKGAITLTPDETIETGIYPVDALKPVGAGDAFLAGLVASLAQERDLRTSILRGSASASIVVSRVGCAIAMPTPEELDQFISTHPGPTS
ncbi:MAG: 5-dehydro-2-deoxygluconokinase [Pseudomonadota bacterium]